MGDGVAQMSDVYCVTDIIAWMSNFECTAHVFGCETNCKRGLVVTVMSSLW